MVMVIAAAFIIGVLVGWSSWLMAAAWLDAIAERRNEQGQGGGNGGKPGGLSWINGVPLRRAI